MTANFLGVEHPIIQAPMGGANATPPALVAAVSNAGALGFLGAAYMSPDQIRKDGAAIRALTSKPFGVNLFAPVDDGPLPRDVAVPMNRIAGYHTELGLGAPEHPTLPTWTFEEQVRACIECGATVFSVTFGLLPAPLLKLLKSAGIYIVGTATTVQEAVLFAESGVDAIAAQGSEAGAHRGSFAKPFEQSMVGILSLVPQIMREVTLPVIAAGGIMDGRAIRAALAVGAQAAQLGTAFLVTDECGVAESYKQAVLASRDDSTKVTRAFSGRPARGIVNRAMVEIESDGAVLPYPYQNSLTRAMRTAAAKQDRAEFLSLWCGQAGHLARRMPAAELVRTLMEELSS